MFTVSAGWMKMESAGKAEVGSGGETNPPRNSWPQTHQDDEGRGAAEGGFASERKQHRIDRFAHASKNS